MSEKWYHYSCTYCNKDTLSKDRIDLCSYCGHSCYLLFVETVPAGYYDGEKVSSWVCNKCDTIKKLSVNKKEKRINCVIEGCTGSMSRHVKGMPFVSTANLAMGDAATPAAIDKWQKQREAKRKSEERIKKEHGSL